MFQNLCRDTAAGDEYRAAGRYFLASNAFQRCVRLGPRMPACSGITPCASLLNIKKTAPVEQSKGEPATRYPSHLANGLPLVRHETERGDCKDMIEAGIGKWQMPHVGMRKPDFRRLFPGEVDLVGIDVDARDLQAALTRKPACEVARPPPRRIEILKG